MKTRIESTAERKRKRHHTTMPRINTLRKSKKYSAHVDPRLNPPRVQWNKFYGSKAWSNLRDSKLLDQPLCEECLMQGKVTPATAVHHKIPFSTGINEQQMWELFLDYDNLESICVACHQKLHSKRH